MHLDVFMPGWYWEKRGERGKGRLRGGGGEGLRDLYYVFDGW